ncbi:DUF4244 domain-containing protein [Gulosibacter bifidus]|uniref:DUF4244 domain-containing protein n=1 Tax=Gulosibacter bifidus TaxID=272239 RepID=A0ABW5RLC7_9MICO|nr:DUF4244 domain-containing protein [Gulosibacter bifidus]
MLTKLRHQTDQVAYRIINRALRDDRGAETAEYAIVIMAAVALAGVLVAVVQSDAVRQIIEDLVTSAFQA